MIEHTFDGVRVLVEYWIRIFAALTGLKHNFFTPFLLGSVVICYLMVVVYYANRNWPAIVKWAKKWGKITVLFIVGILILTSVVIIEISDNALWTLNGIDRAAISANDQLAKANSTYQKINDTYQTLQSINRTTAPIRGLTKYIPIQTQANRTNEHSNSGWDFLGGIRKVLGR